MKLHYWKRTSLTVLESWKKIREDAFALTSELKKEYHLK